MVSMLISNGVNHRFEHRLDQTKDYEIGICCSQQAPFGRKSKAWLIQKQENVRMELHVYRRVLFQWVSTMRLQLKWVDLV